jgi:hypothetical protein
MTEQRVKKPFDNDVLRNNVVLCYAISSGAG